MCSSDLNGFDDPATAFVDYGWPTVEVNREGHILIAYMRSSADHFPEARFTVRLAGESDVRPSRLLMGGEMPYVEPDKFGTPESPVSQVDLGGSSVDAFDDESIWFVEPYAFKPPNPKTADRNFRLAVGKAFGRRLPDLTFSRLALDPSLIARPGGAIGLRLTIRNQGDAAAAPTVSRLFLERTDGAKRILVEIAALSIDSLPGGGSADKVVRANLEDDLPSGRYRVLALADADHDVTEYSESNNEERSQRTLFVPPRRVRRP